MRPRPQAGRAGGPTCAILAPLLLAATLVVAAHAALAAPLARPSHRTPELPVTRDSLLARFPRDSLTALRAYDRGHRDSAYAILRRNARAARLVRDSSLVARSLLLDAYVVLEELPRPGILEKILAGNRIARSAGDSATWMRGICYESIARSRLGQPRAAAERRRDWLTFAEDLRDTVQQGHAHYSLAFGAWQDGERAEAREHLVACTAIFEAHRMRTPLARSLNLLANVDLAEGRYSEARASYRRVIPIAQQLKDRSLEGYAWNNLGAVETHLGDPARALQYYRKAQALHRSRGAVADEVETAGDIGEVLLWMGLTDQARETLEAAVARAEKDSAFDALPRLNVSLGKALEAAGRREAAKTLWRGVAALSDSAHPGPRVEAAIRLAAALAGGDSLGGALVVLQTANDDLAAHAEAAERGQLRLELARVLERSGRPAEALARARPVATDADARGDLSLAVPAWTTAARCERRLGQLADAHADLARATDAWERGRRRIADPEHRETEAGSARSLMTEVIADALALPASDPVEGRTQAAFESPAAVQDAHAARTRRRTGRGNPLARVGGHALARRRGFRRQHLAPGELFLEYATSAETTFVFAVTRDTCVVRGLPGERALGATLDLARDALAQPQGAGASDGPAANVGRRLGATLLGTVQPWIAPARMLVIAPDGALRQIPFGALIPPGSREPLGMTHDIAQAPSATLLAAIERRAAAPVPSRLLAIEGGPRAGESPLAGARREVSELIERFRGVVRWASAAPMDSAAHADALPLAGYAGLHFAGHTALDDQSPWRSGFLLGSTTDGDDSVLTATEIAAMQLSPRLVVLSACESAGPHRGSGEGVAGLSSAFLVAGAPAVLATLWPVDDATTAAWMSHFYDALARGQTAAASLRTASQWMRRQAGTAHPFYWAGFQLAGEGSARLPLERAPESPLARLRGWWRARTSR